MCNSICILTSGIFDCEVIGKNRIFVKKSSISLNTNTIILHLLETIYISSYILSDSTNAMEWYSAS
jgi:hypothetical protein